MSPSTTFTEMPLGGEYHTYKSHCELYASSRRFRDIKDLNLLPWKCSSMSRSTTLAIGYQYLHTVRYLQTMRPPNCIRCSQPYSQIPINLQTMRPPNCIRCSQPYSQIPINLQTVRPPNFIRCSQPYRQLHNHEYKWTVNGQADSHADILIDRLTDIQTERHPDRHLNRHTDRKTCI